MNIVIANAASIMDTGQEVVPFPSRWDSGLPRGMKPLFYWMPYELAYTTALLKRELPDAKVKLIDGNIAGWDGDRYIQEIAKLQPDVLICECSALTYPTMTRVMQGYLERRFVEPVRTILCGPMAADAQRAKKDLWDDVVVGEYELKVLELLGGTVPDVAYTDAGLINLDWLPWPEDEDISRIRYDECNHYAKGMIQAYFSRGCPLSCDFCVVPSLYGGHGKSHRSHRVRDVEDCCQEVLYLKAMYGDRMGGIYANEEAHNANVPWLVELCEAFIRHGMKDKHNLRFDAMTGYWTYTEELIKLMARAGYNQIRFGVESTSEQVGKKIGKTIHLEKMESVMRWCKKYGIHCYGTIQIGCSGSTEQTDLQTLADLRRWAREGLMEKWQVSTSTPQPSTPMYKQAKERGWLTTTDINLYDGVNAVIDRPEYPAERVYAVRMSAP